MYLHITVTFVKLHICARARLLRETPSIEHNI